MAQDRLETVMTRGMDIQKLDVLDLEGTARVSSAERAQLQGRIATAAQAHAAQYREAVFGLASTPQRDIRSLQDRRFRSGTAPPEARGVATVVDLHLRLTRAKIPPNTAEIIRDFGSLRYLGHARSDKPSIP